ncbi:MAG: phage portal protein [FCB group bacterium]|nr:phage portal protein [FCB group bacterium]
MGNKKSVKGAGGEVNVGIEAIDTPSAPTTVKQALVKALVITGRADNIDEAIKTLDEHDGIWEDAEAVDPLLDLESLMSLYEISDSLRQNVDAYVTNIEANGHVLEPKIDLNKKGVDNTVAVKTAMDAANWADAVTAALSDLNEEAEAEGVDVTDEMRTEAINSITVAEPTDEQVRARTEELRLQMQREMHMAKAWFRNVHPSLSFIDLRERKRVDEETIGHAAWEVRRDDNNMIRRLEPMPGYTILPVKASDQHIEVKNEEWVSDIDTRPVIESVKFRRYVQLANGRSVYYKDLNDPRLVSDRTGKVYMKVDGEGGMKPDPAKMKEDEPQANPANEVIYFAIYHPKTTAGMIRWAGLITAVIGSRAAAEANLAYFENHAVPDAVLLVSGGQLNNESVQRIQEALRSKAKGPGNHHRTLVIQATAKGSQPNQEVNNPDMEWVNLSDFQNGDALFQGYTENNKVGVSSAFRQALLLIGHIPSDLNRATAYAVLSLIEKQVYGPLRNKFDWWVNNTLLPSIGIKLIRFISLSPEATNIEEMSKALEQGIKGGAFTPNDLRAFYSKWLNVDLPRIDAPWADVPLSTTLSQLNLGAEPPSDEDGGGDDEDDDNKPAKNEKLASRLTELESNVSKLLKRLEKDDAFAETFGQ